MFFKRGESVEKLRITPECFNKSLTLVNNDIIKQITNRRDGSTQKLNLAAKILHVDLSVVLFSSSFLLCRDLKFDLMFLTQLI